MGLVVDLFRRLFTSKEEKIRKAIDKMKRQLESGIEESMNKNKKELLANINSSMDSGFCEIEDAFTSYIEGSKIILERMGTLLQKSRNAEDAINSLVGFRILDYVKKNKVKDKKVKEMTNEFLTENYPVVRDWTNQS